MVYADIAGCAGSLDHIRLSEILRHRGAPGRAVDLLDAMHRGWWDFGAQGLPLGPTFWVLLRFYLQGVDERLYRAGVPFVRCVDDYRLLSHGEDEAEKQISVLREALASQGLQLNESKTRIFTRAGVRSLASQKRLIWTGRLKEGVLKPVLTELLRFSMLRPAVLPVLKLFCASQVQPLPCSIS